MSIRDVGDKVEKVITLYEGDKMIPSAVREVFILNSSCSGIISPENITFNKDKVHVLMKKYKVLDVTNIKNIDFFMERLMRYLLDLHDRGIIWCDVKDHNILVSEYDDPILIDFGSSQFMEIPLNEDYVTKGYFPDDTLITEKSDTWSLGLVFLMIKLKKNFKNFIGSFKDYKKIINDEIKNINDPLINMMMFERKSLSECYNFISDKCLNSYTWYNRISSRYDPKVREDPNIREVNIFKNLLSKVPVNDLVDILSLCQITKALFSQDKIKITNKEILNYIITNKISIFN